MRSLRQFGLVGLVLAVSGCAGPPPLQVPVPPAAGYVEIRPAALSAVSAETLYVVGTLTRLDGESEALILRTQDRGRSFRRQGMEVHDLRRLNLTAVAATDRLRVWTGGTRTDSSGRVLAVLFLSVDGGNHWREISLPLDPAHLPVDVQEIVLHSDSEAAIRVRCLRPADGQEVVSEFHTRDHGRSFIVTVRAEPATELPPDRTRSFLDAERGFRLAESATTNRTYLEVTGSGGQDWLPLNEITLGLLDTH
jgi:hypothetical protein